MEGKLQSIKDREKRQGERSDHPQREKHVSLQRGQTPEVKHLSVPKAEKKSQIEFFTQLSFIPEQRAEF